MEQCAGAGRLAPCRYFFNPLLAGAGSQLI